MPYNLKGRNVLVTGGSRGLGEYICVKFAEEGANVAINFCASEDRAKGVLGKVKSKGVKGVIIGGDMAIETSCTSVIQETISQLGGLDIIIANAGYTRFSTFSDLTATTTSDWDTCFAVNIKSLHYLLREALSTFNDNSEAAQLQWVKCMAGTQGPKVRVNAVLPGWLATEWGEKYTPEQVEKMNEQAWLGKPVSYVLLDLCGHCEECFDDRTEDPSCHTIAIIRSANDRRRN
ncbi:putative Versicolorin reductase [Glarea lozoyensis 74030]|uniref:Putative Versicolorin reductase n=1 Tax=Glarea lozoyensis (strain ATCC 74030 / MF5533) TaxID=1104152 RepID=H0ENF6_GLAL7|nr:putative Versicolorin reductase [Glarea lozoyensis 74030]